MAERKWTPAQNDAITADSGTVLVSAAAGSGKTSVLVERIVGKITDENCAVPPESLLVVTFTNAAAAEMRARIYKRVSEKLAENPERKNEYVLLLSKLSEMQVCTMDSFCLNLIKEYSHLVGIEQDFRILEQAEEKKLKYEVCVKVCEKRFVENFDTFDPLTKMFEGGRKDNAFINTIISLADYSVSEPDPNEWLTGVADNFSESDANKSVWSKCITDNLIFTLNYCLELNEAAFSDIGEDSEIEAKLFDFFTADKQTLEDAYNVIKNGTWNEKSAALHKVTANLTSRFPQLRGYTDNPSKCSAQAKRNEYKAVLRKALEKVCCSEQENKNDIAVLSPIAQELITTVKMYNEYLLAAKKEMSAFAFSDISHFALSLLFDSHSPDKKTPLARELTQNYSEILIDEYQDTNRAQDTLFSVLSKDGKNMFLVGDVKQSIYRFRLASPEIFIEKCNEFPYFDGKADKSKIILSENFRSRKGVLDGVNFVFSSLMSKECGEIEYNEDERLNFPSTSEDDGSTSLFCAFIEAGEEKKPVVEARYIANVIKDKLENAYTGSGENRRRVRPSDFCILLRSRGSTLAYLVKELTAAGLPVSSESSESFFETPEIKLIMSYLKIIDNPLLDTDLLAVLLSPLYGFTYDEVARLRLDYGRKGSVYSLVCSAAANGNEKCAEFTKKIGYFKKLSSCLPVDSLIREIYSESGLPYIVSAMSDGKKRNSNLEKLLETAENGSEYRTSLGSFLRYADTLRENSTEVSGKTDTEGIKIMSMHKSKGLEFPFVFIAGTTTQFNKQDLSANLIVNHNYGIGIKRRENENLKLYDTMSSVAVRCDSEMAAMSEELRIYYVAMTRAKEELHIVCGEKKMSEKLTKTEYLLSNMKRISPYVVRDATTPFEWMAMCFLRHPDGQNIRFVTPNKTAPLGKADIKFIPEPPSAFSAEVFVEEKAESDEKTIEKIRENASFSYKWEAVSRELSKHTASSLNEEHFDPAGFGKSVPGFMFANKMSPADVGTATHRFLQFCDFQVCETDIESEKQRLVQNGRLSEKQAQSVDVGSVEAFIHSDIMERIKKAKSVYREKQFTLSKSVCDLNKSLPEEFCDEKTVIIGKTDLVFVEDDGAVIVDYKTDNINDVNVLAERYKSQMRIYIEATQKAQDIRVKECILYSLKLKTAISLPVDDIFEKL